MVRSRKARRSKLRTGPKRSMRPVHIEPKSEGKGRTFHALMLASVEADLLWSGGQSDNMRPIWAMFAGSQQELRAFMANLATGRFAVVDRNGYRSGKQDRIEFLRSARYQTIWQREDEGCVATMYLPDLFKLDPGMVNPAGVGFVLLPTQEWHARQSIDTAPLARHLERCGAAGTPEWAAEWGVTAHLFAAYLDRRTRCPLVADGRFYIQLMAACLQNGLASFAARDSFTHERSFGVHPSHSYYETDITSVGFRRGLVFRASHEDFEKLLATEVERFFQLTGGRRGKK